VAEAGKMLDYQGCLEIARTAHLNQKRWDGEDYVEHPIRLSECFPDDPEFAVLRMACLLHDVPEDNPNFPIIRLAEMGVRSDVLKIVEALTHRANESYAEYLERLAEDSNATKIKLLDIQDNCAPLPFGHQRRQKYEVAKLYLELVESNRKPKMPW
jgi:(p)ppGpp synthase/HD superfamily hydrolase